MTKIMRQRDPEKQARKEARKYAATKYPEETPNKLRALKIKIKSLAAEAQIIRLDERKALNAGRYMTYNSLRNRRVHDVREEARASLLAYAILRNRTYASVESSTHQPLPAYMLEKIDKIVGRFGDRKNVSAKDWIKAVDTEVPVE